MRVREPSLLRKFRLHQRLSLRDLGLRVEVSGQFLQQLETGRKRSCSDRVGRLIAHHLDVPADVLFDRQERIVRAPKRPRTPAVTPVNERQTA